MKYYNNTANELVKRGIRTGGSGITDAKIYAQFGIPKEKIEDFELYLEFKLYMAQKEGIKAGEDNIKYGIKQLLDIKIEDD